MITNRSKLKTVFEFVSTNVLSGLENVVINICLLLKNYKIVYISPSGPIDKYLNKYNINHIVVNRLTPFSVRFVIKKYRPDVVHGHDVKASLYLAFNKNLCHKYGIRIISELHNDDRRMWHISFRSVLYALSAHCYDKIILVSSAIYRHYIFNKCIRNKIVIIPNIVNTDRIVLKKKYVKKWDCIFLGRLVNQKNPLKFVKIIEKLKEYDKNIKAIMLGEGPLMSFIQSYISKHYLRDNIKVVGFKNSPFKYLSESRILLMPSKYEGFGLVALESLLVGTPVICSYTGGLISIVNSSCGYFADSIKDYVDDIDMLLNNLSEYKLKSKNSVKHGNEINNIKRFIIQYEAVYND